MFDTFAACDGLGLKSASGGISRSRPRQIALVCGMIVSGLKIFPAQFRQQGSGGV